MKRYFFQAAVYLVPFLIQMDAHSHELVINEASVIITASVNHMMQETAWKIINEKMNPMAKWEKRDRINADGINIVITIKEGLENSWLSVTPEILSKLKQMYHSEGFLIAQETESSDHTIWLITEKGRSIVFAVGALLRSLSISGDRVTIDDEFELITFPKYAIRGHQIGYRHTANSYDAWSVDQYDDYIRDLALFGTNAIENIPLGSDGDDSPHMEMSRRAMNREISAICASYDLDYWVWTPATYDLTDHNLRAEALRNHEILYRECQRLDGVFFPGGDPGHNHPRDVLPFLKDLSLTLRRYHPKAGIWLSLQGFNQEQVDYFYTYLDENKPTWLTGVVTGPSSPPLSETRFRLPKEYLHRHYPDITHNVRCDYPAQNWDQAFALTLGREGSNPQPYYYANVHAQSAPFTDGFISYSDGAHDDVNKFIWSQRGWDPQKEVRDILVDYCKFFFSAEVACEAADGILGLERNWAGPLATNGGVEMTFSFWQNLEEKYPALESNWRWQLLLLRAYYDTYIRRRLINEQAQERQANKALLFASEKGSSQVMQEALDLITTCERTPVSTQLKEKINQLGEQLYKSIGLQTRLQEHQARSAERGCILDFIDYPLNNRWWYEDQFKRIDSFSEEKEKVAYLMQIATWENPGPGSYYDDVSNVAKSPHVQTTVSDATDFAWWDHGRSRARLSWQTFQNDPILAYEDLDPSGRYVLRVCGYGEALARVDNRRLQPIKYDKGIGGFKEFIIPRNLVGDGKLNVTFDQPEESHLNWRHHSRVSDVWLIKK